MLKGSNNIKSYFSCGAQELQQMEKNIISPRTNQMHPALGGTHHLHQVCEPHLSALLSLHVWLDHNTNNSQTLPQFDSESPFSESRGQPNPASAFQRREAERGSRAQFPRILVGFGAELCSLARHSLEAGLDAGDRTAGVARFTLQEIQASVLLQDGLWGATSVARDIFLCRGEKVVVIVVVHTGMNE